MLQEVTEDGFRRTHTKSRHLSLVQERAKEAEDRGDEAKIVPHGGYHYLYVKKKNTGAKK